MIELNEHLRNCLASEGAFESLLNTEGVVHRSVANRKTVEFEACGRRYFIKIHRGCGWGEILKNLIQGKPPVLGARTEWEAIERFQKLGIRTSTVAGKGERGRNPARRESFLVTEAMDQMISLETLTRHWGGLAGRRQPLLKRALLKEVATISRQLHTSGMNHRDFYLCHFLVKDRAWPQWQPGDPTELVLIDLHRAQSRARVPERWLVKDLGGLLFSSLDCGLTGRDFLRFLRIYRGTNLRKILKEEETFWRRVVKNAMQLYEGFHGKPADPSRIGLAPK